MQFPVCINDQTRYLIRGRTEGRGVMCDTLPVHILGYCFGKGVCVDTLVMNQSDCLANYLDVAGKGWYHVGHHIIGGLTN